MDLSRLNKKLIISSHSTFTKYWIILKHFRRSGILEDQARESETKWVENRCCTVSAVEMVSLTKLTIAKCRLFRSSTHRLYFNALAPYH
jgi:hypothetical protein